MKKYILGTLPSFILFTTMFVSSTFAWFTDFSINQGNRVQSGNLSVGFSASDNLTNLNLSGSIQDLKLDNTPIFNLGNAAQPGDSQQKYIRIRNEGNIAINYQVTFDVLIDSELAEVILFEIQYIGSSTQTISGVDIDQGVYIELQDDEQGIGGLLRSDSSHPQEFEIWRIRMSYSPLGDNDFNNPNLEFAVDIKLNAWQFNYQESFNGSSQGQSSQSSSPSSTSNVTSSGSNTSSSSSSSGSSSSSSSSSTTIPSSEVLPNLPLANGIFDFTGSSFAQKGEILGQLEKFAQDEFISGIPLYDNAANLLYNPRVTIPSDVFIPNYGFGVSEGTITAPLTAAQEPVEAYRNYFHSSLQSQPSTLNLMNDQTSVLTDLASQYTLSYWGKRFNDDKSGYEWYPVLATGERPVALNANENGLATKWRVPVRVGGDLKYSTLTTDAALVGFNNRPVALEDYLTPFKLMLDYNLLRVNLLTSESSGLKGAAEYLAEVAKGDAGNPDFNSVGIKLNSQFNAIEFELTRPLSSFFAMNTLSNNIYSPLPQAFIDAIGGPLEYGKPTEAVDNLLSLGAYTMERFEPLKQIVLKKNTTSIESSRYNFAGYMYTIISGGLDVIFNEFLVGKLDVASIPASRLQEFLSDPRRRKTLGATTFKVQVNGTDQQRWEELFGENGSVLQTAVDEYYEVEPIMSNKDFLNGFYFAIDRQGLADYTGRNPAPFFFSDAYMIDPENGISYRSSAPGLAAYEDRLPETFGYSQELARAYFRKALTDLVDLGEYQPGTSSDPTEIVLNVHMQTQASVNLEGALLKTYVEPVFNLIDPRFKLTLNTFATANWFDVYYNSMLTGQFDMAVGTISGNTLDPLNFMDTLMSDQRSGFTLSWGADTNTVSQNIRYDGKAWSYEALYEASQSGAVVSNGQSASLFSLDSAAVSTTPVAGAYEVSISGKLLTGVTGVEVNIDAITLWSYETETEEYIFQGSTLDEVLTITQDGTFEVLINGVLVKDGAYSISFYYTVTSNGSINQYFHNSDIVYPVGFF